MLFKSINVYGLNISYREAGNEAAPKLVLLHGCLKGSRAD
jgi:hypothetical protein